MTKPAFKHTILKLAMWIALCLTVFAIWANLTFASDIPALEPLSTQTQASEICPQSCAKHDCGWSGQWKPATNAGNGMCDCGPVRVIKIPAGVIRTQEQAAQACNEICTYNDKPWTGEWDRVPGAFDTCSCSTIADWCEPKTE